MVTSPLGRSNTGDSNSSSRSSQKSSRPTIEIRLDNDAPGQPENFISSFTTLDKIVGQVIIKPSVDTRFKRLEVAFRGFQLTKINQVVTVAAAANVERSAFHLFLEVYQPHLERLYPEDMILRAGETYKFPIDFTVPAKLAVDHCRHRHDNDRYKLSHVLLPPSLGDKEVSGIGRQFFSDFSLDMWARIAYAIDVRVVDDKTGGYRDEVTVAEKKRKLRVIPASEELPPVGVDGKDSEYRLRSEKTIRKKLVGGKSGNIVVSAYQPMSFRLPRVGDTDADEVRDTLTTLTCMLRFDPTDAKSKPPKVNKLSAKLKAVTYYSNRALKDFPCRTNILYDISQAVWDESVPLLSRRVDSVKWRPHEPGTRSAVILDRRESTSLTNAPEWIPEPSEHYSASKPFHTAQLLVPMALPKKKVFVPSFNQCFISRSYIIDFTIDVEGGPIGGINLKVPIQVSADAAPEVMAQLPSLSDEIDQGEDVDAYFNPRNVVNPAPQYQAMPGGGASARDNDANDDELPGYPPTASFHRRAGAVVPVAG